MTHPFLTANPRIAEIQIAVCLRFNIDISEMRSERRHAEVAVPRQIAMYLSRKMTLLSLTQIGRQYRKHHSTVIHAGERITERMAFEPDLAREVLAIRAGIERGHAFGDGVSGD